MKKSIEEHQESADDLKEKIKLLEKYFSEELKRKDKIIEDLREQNIVIIRSALKESKKIDKLTQALKKAVEK